MLSQPKLENGVFEDTYTTSFSQTGIHDVLTNKSLLSILENIAGRHSAYVHFTFTDISKYNLTWVLLNWKLKVLKRIKGEENIRIQTWGRIATRIFVLRDFKIYDEQGNLCVIATSKWCLVDTTKGKIAKIPDNIGEIYGGFHNNSVFEIEDVPKLTEPTSSPIASDTYKIRRFDLDLNKHVHNLNYLNIAYELLPEDVYDGEELNNVEILYKKELKYGDVVKSYLYKDNDMYTVVLKSQDDSVLHSIIKLY